MEARLSIEHISFGYAPGTEVFHDISLSVNNGEVFCLLGPNGTGKSTLLKCAGGILGPMEGRVLIDGEDISGLTPARIARAMAYVPQSHQSVFPFLVKDVIVMGRTPHLSMIQGPSREDRNMALEAMEAVGVSHLADRPCTEISGGEWQLVLIARALTQRSGILLLDEPTSHLDLGNQMKILRVIHSLAESGLTILMASHFPDHAFLTGTRAAVMKGGTLTVTGTPGEVVTAKTMEETYGVKVKVIHVGDGVNRQICVPMLEG